MTNKQKNYKAKSFLSLKELGPELETYAKTDPRFQYTSDAARHLITLGMKADKAARDKALREAGL